ncbi:hypothetical protein SAMN04515658_1102 [Idiomarina zobellii]|nr:hypothetical protein SAMN04515658_1102 [Idiomarina zobellii]
MPIQPKPFRIYCEQCKWSTAVRPISDVLTEAECPRTCPKCGNKELVIRGPRLVDKVMYHLGL